LLAKDVRCLAAGDGRLDLGAILVAGNGREVNLNAWDSGLEGLQDLLHGILPLGMITPHRDINGVLRAGPTFAQAREGADHGAGRQGG
jgi:hypothetical protein